MEDREKGGRGERETGLTRMMPDPPAHTAILSPHQASLHQARAQPPSLSTVPFLLFSMLPTLPLEL